MRYSFISAAVLAFTSIVSAAVPTSGFDQITVPSKNIDTVKVGDVYTIQWVSTAAYPGTITISLMQGASNTTLQVGDVIASNVDGAANKYDWTIKNVPSYPVYGIQISLDSNPAIIQWSFYFYITGTGTSSSSGSATGTGYSTGSLVPTSTKTVFLSTGTAYTASSSSSSTTLKVAPSSFASNSTTTTAAAKTSSSSATTAASNATLSGGATLSPSQTSSSASSSSSSAPAKTGAAVANLAQGSLAVFGGLVLAFAL